MDDSHEDFDLYRKWWTTWLEPGEDVPVMPDWVSVEGWYRAKAEAEASRG